ncbi:nuclear pore complex protein Nup153 isoform X2 [Centropristis striata]|uniref:nuclear pore complex protein Nup153 isoform X2 n=1 Tax=Centropristis striata TaxID=184440 RepID=UPI0027E12E91|nr:nuclear pore complex protein Nup153 isoform X2 [Centropristis striata]
MAATGGGKIRSRRYHIASKPYAKSKQQSGLISRVTDTVKSIVPSWLQKYFKNEDAAEGEGAVLGTNQNCQPPQPPNGSEEGPPPIDGRDSPEPSTSNTEPSTSRASLNFQDYVLSRPPLSRSHLHFSPLDVSSPTLGASSSLFSQPSTSSAPGPFSTGFSLVKEIKDNLSQHEDDNISTTSGFSSRASDKDVPTSKTASLPQLWSPETDRTHSGSQHAQSSLKKPAFNLSVFGTSSNSSLNSTVLNSSQLGDSPFYPGKTMYGGAAAVRSSRARPGTPYQAPVRRQIKAKPAGAQPCGVTSATARRILQSLERMSSPLADARRIPAAASSPLSASMDGTNLDVPSFQSKKKRMDSSLPPVQKLVVPSAASVSGNRSVSFRPTLTPGGVSRTLDRTPRETPTRQSPQLPEVTPGPSQSTMGSSVPVYPLSSTPAASGAGSGGGKMKRERTSTRPSSKRPEEEEVAEVPDLPTISLPISTSALPTFSFSSPLPPLTTSTTVSPAPSVTPVTPAKETIINKEPPAASTPPCVPFTFSSPIVKATAASPPSFSPSAGFTFSAPVAKLGPSMSNGKLASPIAAAVKSATSNSTEDFEGPFKPAKTLKQGSVLDLLKAPGFASPVARTSPGPNNDLLQTSTPSTAPFSSSTTTTTTSSLSSTGFGDVFKAPSGWSCDVCLVQNKSSDTKCVCCMTPQPNSSPFKSTDNKPSAATSVVLESSSTNTTSTTTTAAFGTMFSKPAGTWDCDTCLVLNKPDAVKCVACETAKPGTGLKPSLTLPSAFSAVKTVSTPTASVSTGFSGFADKFKKPEGAWECDTCLVQNKAEDTKCVACSTTKPGASVEGSSSAGSAPVFGLGDAFKKPEGSWECDVCLVQNNAADVQCVACQTAKPGAKVEPKAFGSSFGSSAGGTSGSSSGGFKFGTSDSSSGSGSGGFKFGTSDNTSGSGSGGFKFGGSLTESSSSSSGGFKFGVPFGSSSSETTSKDTTATSGFKFGSSSEGFKFGAASSDDKTPDQPAAGSGFKFGSSSGTAFGTGSSSTEGNSSKGGFTFGLSKPEEKTSDTITTTTSSSVSFTPASSQEKNDSATSSNDATSTNTNPTTTTTTTTGSVFGRLGVRPVQPTTETVTVSALDNAFEEPAAPTFTFGKPEEKKEAAASPAPSAFLFGAASKDADATSAPATSGGFSFSKPSAPTEQPPPPYNFGKPADKTETSTAEAPKPSFTFGQSAADSSAPKPAFSFMASNPTNTVDSTTSSSTTPTPSLFGTTATSTSSSSSSTQAPAPSAAPSTFMFGQPAAASSDAPPAKSFVFGQSQDSQPPAPSAAPLNSTQAPAPSQPFIFGAPASAAPPAAAAAPSFGFGAAAPSAASSSAPSAAPFAFSSTPSGGFGANQTPSFGSSFGSPFTATPSQPPAFGAKPNAAPVFGQQTNSTPVFGAAANSAPGGGFQFGGASAFGATNNTSGGGVFTFGAGSAASPAPPANPSVAPQPGPPGGGFNFSQPPAFNIGSTKSFTASPAGQQSIAGRKIKTAVRRRK